MTKLTGFMAGVRLRSISQAPTPSTDNPPPVTQGPIVNEPAPPEAADGLTLYSGFNFTGDSVFVNADTPNLSSLSGNWLDKTRSFKFRRLAYEANRPYASDVRAYYAIFYSGLSYNGRVSAFQPGDYPNSITSIGDNISRSLKFVTTTTNIGGEDYGNGCFHPDTLITMADMSKKPISKIEEGDEVLSLSLFNFPSDDDLHALYGWRAHNINNAKKTTAIVNRVLGRKYTSYLNINDLKVTLEHPLLVYNGNFWAFKQAGAVKPREVLKTLNGTEEVACISKVLEDTHYWNLDVSGSNLYFANDKVVHNALLHDSISPEGPQLFKF
jgi:hypothetical protein